MLSQPSIETHLTHPFCCCQTYVLEVTSQVENCMTVTTVYSNYIAQQPAWYGIYTALNPCSNCVNPVILYAIPCWLLCYIYSFRIGEWPDVPGTDVWAPWLCSCGFEEVCKSSVVELPADELSGTFTTMAYACIHTVPSWWCHRHVCPKYLPTPLFTLLWCYDVKEGFNNQIQRCLQCAKEITHFSAGCTWRDDVESPWDNFPYELMQDRDSTTHTCTHSCRPASGTVILMRWWESILWALLQMRTGLKVSPSSRTPPTRVLAKSLQTLQK